MIINRLDHNNKDLVILDFDGTIFYNPKEDFSIDIPLYNIIDANTFFNEFTFTPIKEKQGFCELYLDYDLTLAIQKKEKHKIVVDGKEHIANVKVYKFEQLDKDTMLKILRIIREKFKKEYYKI